MKTSFLSFFTPKDKTFAPHFREVGSQLLQAGELLIKIANQSDTELRIKLIGDMDKLESKSDHTTHTIIQALSGTFITPFDREDIYRLANLLDDVVDFINIASKKIRIYQVNPTEDDYIQPFAELINQSCGYIERILFDIQRIRKENISSRVIEVHSVENQADTLFDEALGNLFSNEKDPIVIIKKKEIYKALEITTDRCEDVMNIIESINIKYS